MTISIELAETLCISLEIIEKFKFEKNLPNIPPPTIYGAEFNANFVLETFFAKLTADLANSLIVSHFY